MDSNQFINFFCEYVLPRWDDITTPEGGGDPKLELLKIFAEITEHCGEIEKTQDKINTVYDILMVRYIIKTFYLHNAKIQFHNQLFCKYIFNTIFLY